MAETIRKRIVLEHKREPARPQNPLHLRRERWPLFRRHVVHYANRHRDIHAGVVIGLCVAVIHGIAGCEVALFGAFDARSRNFGA